MATNLLVLCQLFYPELVSTGQTLTELCEGLADFGVDIEVVCGPETVVDRKNLIPKYLEYRGIRITRVWGTRFPKLHLFGRIVNQVTYASSVFLYLFFYRDKRPILVLTNPPFLAFTCAILKKLGIGNPYLYLIFDVYPDTAVNLGVLKATSCIARIWNKMNRFVFRKADRIIVIGRCMQENIIKKLEQVQIPVQDKVQFIHIWSDDMLIRSALGKPNPFIQKWNLANKFVISYSGNMGRFHDMETIMDTVKDLQSYSDILFLFIGEGYKKPWMVEFVKQWQLSNCQFHSYVPREELGFSLSCAQLGLVSLAKGQEGLSVPSKTFGLMAAGLPIIAIMSPQSEIARVIREENCGYIVDPGDKDDLRETILSLYNNREKLTEMGRNAQQAITAKYNLRSAVQEYYSLINKLNQQISSKKENSECFEC
ncbi:MAG: glycosyltransferase family 4 protein [bacterium]|nr:glycosyltransferase family 4 protein [bacterium]